MEQEKKAGKVDDPISESRSWATGSMRFRPSLVFALFILLFVLSRSWILWYCPPHLLDGEDLTRGMLPLHLLRGLLMPYHLYQYDPYAGGGMVIGLVAYPFFEWLGPTLTALQSSALVFSLALLIGMFGLSRRFFGESTAVCLGILFLFPPFFYLRTSLVSTGNHLEIGTFYILGLYLLFLSRQPIRSRFERWPGRFGLLFLFGILSGFGIYFEYEYLILLAVVAPFFWLAAPSWKTAFWETATVLIGIRIGLTPWYQFHGPVGFIHYLRAFAGAFHDSPVGSYNDPGLFLQAVTTNLIAFFQSHDLRTPGKVWVEGGRINQMFSGLWAVSYLYLCLRYRNEAFDFFRGVSKQGGRGISWARGHVAIVLLAYVPVHVVVYALHRSYQPIPPFRYLHPVFPFYFLIPAVALGLLWERGRKGIAVAGLAVGVFAGVAGNMGFFEGSIGGFGMTQPGYETRYFHNMLHNAYPLRIDRDRYAATAESVFPGREQEFYSGVCAGIAYMNGVDIDGHVAAAKGKGKGAWTAFIAGLGAAVAVAGEMRNDRRMAIQDLFEDASMPWFSKGVRMGREFRNRYD